MTMLMTMLTTKTASAPLAAAVLLLAFFSHTAVLTTPALAVGRPDPTCARGLPARGACCARRCGRCGGSACYNRSKRFGTPCCPGGIKKRGSGVGSCRTTGPPCKLPSVGGGGGGGGGVDTTKGTWRHAPVVSGTVETRHEACAVMVNGLVVLVGGRGVNKATNIYNPATNKWSEAPGPGPGIEIHHFQCVAANGKVWIVSSWTGPYPFERNNKRVFVFDVRRKSWSTRNGMPAWRNRAGAAAVRKGNIIYVVAGNRGGHGAHAQTLGWMDAFNWRTGKWLTKRFPSVPPGGERDHTGGALVKGQLCIAGGRDGGSANFFDDVNPSTYCYSFSRARWTRKQDFPKGRAGAATAATCDARMMVAGGEGNGRAYRRVDVFDGTVWKRAPDLKTQRHGSGIAVAKCACGHLFIPSGSGGLGGGPELTTTERFVPRGKKATCGRY